ncbi:TPA: hypothetical protein DEP21_05330 [Patescibacteria group bacterium]|nr:hypothetical protein [Candidatus Gracilibacteria bacterium]
MIKYFSLVLELMNIEAHEKYLEVAQYIEQHPSMILSLCHPYGFIFAAFSDLVQGKIFEDQFVAL